MDPRLTLRDSPVLFAQEEGSRQRRLGLRELGLVHGLSRPEGAFERRSVDRGEVGVGERFAECFGLLCGEKEGGNGVVSVRASLSCFGNGGEQGIMIGTIWTCVHACFGEFRWCRCNASDNANHDSIAGSLSTQPRHCAAKSGLHCQRSSCLYSPKR